MGEHIVDRSKNREPAQDIIDSSRCTTLIVELTIFRDRGEPSVKLYNGHGTFWKYRDEL